MTHFQHLASREWCPSKTEERLAPTITLKSNWAQRLGLKSSRRNGETSSTAAIWKQQRSAKPAELIRRHGEACSFEKSGRVWSTNVEVVHKDEEIDQEGTERPFQDSRIHGMSHSEVQEAEQNRVHELIYKIESRPHQGDLPEDLKQTKVFNPFSENSKTLIRETGNVEYFELCESDSQVQCLCLSYRAKWIVYYLWDLLGSHWLDASNEYNKIWHHVDRGLRDEGVGYGARDGKSAEQLFYHKSFNAWNRCRRHKDVSGEYFAGILDRFQRDPVFRASQELMNWTEDLCKKMDEKAQEDRMYKLTREKPVRPKSIWGMALNNSASNALTASWLDSRAAIALTNHLCRRSKAYQAPIPPQDQDRVREGDKFSETYHQGPRVDKKIVWKYWPSSSSSSTRWLSDNGDWKRLLFTNTAKVHIIRFPGAEHVALWNPTEG